MGINWTTIAATAITAAVNGATMFFVVRYLNKMVEKIENVKVKKNNKDQDKCDII